MRINSVPSINNNYKINTVNSHNRNEKISFKGKESEIRYQSAIPLGVGFISSIRRTPLNKTGEIGASKQGATGDCYLLSAINALSYTQKGAEILKECLSYSENGTTVNLKGIGHYYISDKELKRAKGSRQYAKGDDDILAIELAIQKVRDDMYLDRFIFTDDAPLDIKHLAIKRSSRLFKPSIDEGRVDEVFYYLTGKCGEEGEDNSSREMLLNKFKNNKGQDFALCASFKPIPGPDGTDYWRISDVDGNSRTLYSEHSYAVKAADDDTVTIVNPHDSAKEIKLSKDKFLLHFDSLYGIDLSDNNSEKHYIMPSSKVIIASKGHGFTQLTKRPDGTIYRRVEGDEKGNLVSKEIFSEDGKLKEQYYYHKNGKIRVYSSYEYFENGEVSLLTEEYYDKKGKKELEIKTNYREDGSINYSSSYYYKNGKLVGMG
ncbi:hypothetical protein II906_06800 [bacterium]|nr:hypothetical protein [bacterium]